MENLKEFADVRLGIDLGGTKTEIIGLEARNGKELYRQRVPTPHGDYAATVKNIAALVETAETTLGRKGTVGVGIPGCMCQQTGVLKNANSIWLNGQKLDRDLSAALGGRDVRLENDANCLAVSEATDGAGQGYKTVLAVIIGTGTGAGIAVECKPLAGINGLGGEWGHNPLPFPRVFAPGGAPGEMDAFFERATNNVFDQAAFPRKLLEQDYMTNSVEEAEFPGLQCYCGRRGCMETWVSGPGMKADHTRRTGQSLSTHDIIAMARSGEAACAATVERYASRLARGLAGVINILDPDIIVLGGGMSNVTSLYERVPELWAPYTFSPEKVVTKLVPTRHGDSSGVRGAAWLWPMATA